MGTATWITLPKHRQPTWWNKYRRPVCKMLLNLYGHPDAGGFWEDWCDGKVTKTGFRGIEHWRSCYGHPDYKALLIVYVDDFKLACPAQYQNTVWSLLRKEIVMGEPSDPDRFLGCYLRPVQDIARTFHWLLAHNPDFGARCELEELEKLTEPELTSTVRGFVYDMEEYFRENV